MLFEGIEVICWRYAGLRTDGLSLSLYPSGICRTGDPLQIQFSQRANLFAFPERLDELCSYEVLLRCLRDIKRINQLTGAYRPTLRWLDYVRTVTPRARTLQVLDVGCGYGDTLRRIQRWAILHNVPMTLIGIDVNPEAIRAAREATHPGSGIRFLTSDVFAYQPESGVDIVLSSLFTHHLPDRDVVHFLAWMEATARVGWFINDLHREPVPYHMVKLLAPFTGFHPFVKHDAAVSILRSFQSQDWHRLCELAAIPSQEYLVLPRRPARLCVARLK